jgi:hypothetical protein
MLTKLLAKSPEILISILAFFSPIKPLILVVGLFIGVDTILGIYKSYRLKQTIKSSIAARGIGSKIILYTGSVIMVYLLEKLIIGELIMTFSTIPYLATKVVALVFCLIEIKSMDESYIDIYGYSLLTKGKELLMKLKATKDELNN